jgi:hypothetical protein
MRLLSKMPGRRMIYGNGLSGSGMRRANSLFRNRSKAEPHRKFRLSLKIPAVTSIVIMS